MAGRPKIQFANQEAGDKAWGLIERIQDLMIQLEQEAFEADVAEIKELYPKAELTFDPPIESAGNIVTRALQTELARLEELVGSK